jgi:hypothetical protein
MQWFGQAWIFSTPNINGQITFFARYMLVGTPFGFGLT